MHHLQIDFLDFTVQQPGFVALDFQILAAAHFNTKVVQKPKQRPCVFFRLRQILQH
jgi:hypothetical protein